MKAADLGRKTVVLVLVLVVGCAEGVDGETQSGLGPPSWRLIDPPLPGAISSISVASENPDRVFFTSDPDGVWQTSDGGATPLTWAFTSLGLFEIHMTRFPVADGNNGRLYALTVGGGFQTSADGGITWSGRSAPAGIHQYRPWVSLAISPIDEELVLAGGNGLLMRSENTGLEGSWTAVWGSVDEPTGVIVTDIEFVAQTGAGLEVWASTARCAAWNDSECAEGFSVGNGALFSGDAGLTWSERPLSPDPNDPRNLVYGIATVPGQPDKGLAATEDGLWTTADAGITWTDQTPGFLTDRKITDVVYVEATIPTVYIGTLEGVAWAEVAGWTLNWQATGFPGDSANFVTALGSHPNQADILYAGYQSGEIYKSEDFGVTVNALSGPHGGYPMATLAIKSDDEETIYVGTVCQQGILKGSISSQGLADWGKMTRKGWNGHFHYVMRLAQHPTDGETIYTTDYNTVWTTLDAGASYWVPLGPGADVHVHGLAIAPSNPQIMYVATGHGNWGTHPDEYKVYRSANGGGGDSWNDVSATLPQWETETSLYDIAVSPLDPDVVYIATFGSENYPGDASEGIGQGVLRTLEGGQSWEVVNDGLRIDDNPGFNLSWFVGKVAMAVRDSTLYTYVATLDGVYEMVGTEGTLWSDISPPGERRFESVAVDPLSPTTLYAGTSAPDSDTPARIYRSKDGGLSWTELPMEMQPRAWSRQYRVRDIQVGPTRAYAVVEGSGIYLLCSNVIPGDCECDGDVDLSDYACFQACLTGPGGGASAGCAAADFNGDDDVDLQDFAVFQTVYTGPQ